MSGKHHVHVVAVDFLFKLFVRPILFWYFDTFLILILILIFENFDTSCNDLHVVYQNLYICK